MPHRHRSLPRRLVFLFALACMLVLPAAANAASGTITYAVSTGTGAATYSMTHTRTGNVGSWKIQRGEAALSLGTCSGPYTYTDIGPANPASPFVDTSPPDGVCVKYQLLVTDSITASVATIAGANIVRFDRTDPTVVLTAASPSPWINTTAKTLNLTRTDATVVTSTVAWQNTTTLATGTACASTTTASCSFNVSTLPDGPYLLTVTSTDTVGRVSTGTLSVMYDVTAPVITLAPANELTGAAYQHRVGSTIFYNPSYAGSFVLGLNASDPGTGANTATYVTFGAGWTFTPTTDNTQPYESTYSWSAGASGSGAKIVNVNDFSGRTATFTLTLTTDTLGPTPGTLGWTPSSASVSLTYTGGSDAASGLGDVQVMRDSAPDTGSCGSPVWTGFANVGAVNPSFPYVDTTVVANTCYRYRIRQFDNVGNFANTSTTSVMSNFSSTDTTNPTGTINATPVAPFSGAKTLTGTSADVGSGIASITLSYSGPQSGSVCTVPSPAASSWVCPWNTATLADGAYTLNLHIVDASSNFSDVTRTVVLDNTLPTGTIAATPLGPVRATATLTGTTADAGTGVQHADVTYAGPASGNVCLGTSPSGAPWSCVWDTTTVPDGTYTITSHVTDYAGNAADITRALVVDNTGPVLAFASAVATSGAAYQYASGSTLWVNPLYAGATDITFTATDAASGMGTVTFPALGSGWTTIGGPVVSAAPFRLNHVRTIGSAAPGSVSVTGTDATGNTATSSFTVTNDALAPTGGTVAAAWGTTDVTLTHTLGSDAGSGMGSHQLQRRQAPRFGPACGSYGTWTDVLAANPVSPAHDTTTAPGTCYQYRLAQTDRVGNVFVVYAAGEVITPASGFGVTNAPASVAVTEGGGSATFTSVLTSAPTANVTITLAAGAQLTTAPAAITFTPANWATPQTITVTAVDDAVAEASPHAASVGFTATSSDTDYAGLSITAVAVAVTDNDAPGLDDLGSSTSVTVAEGGATDTFVYRLGSQPTAPVTVALGSDAQVTTTPATLTFTTANWNVAQTVTVAAVDDFVSEGAHTGAITPTVTSPDPIYTGLLAAPVSASVVDDDTAGVTVTPGASLAVTEGGVNGSFSAQLTSEPTGTVTIAFTPDAQLATSTTAFTFTPANWNVPQVATVDAVDDSIVEASPHAGSIALVAASADAFYGGIAIADVSADISDNDVVGITVAANAFTLAEGGSSTTADVVLASQPTADVTIAVTSPDSQLLVDQSTLTFTALDWNVPQTITIDAVDDAVGEISPHTGTLAFTVTSADAGWSGAPVADVLFAITDDDGPPADLVPPVGGAVNVVEHWVNTPTNPVPFVVGTDAGSGIGTWRLQRRLATLAGGACQPFGAWSNRGSANPASPATDLPPNNSCAEYRLVVTDLAGNVATSSGSGSVKVDRTVPFGALDDASASAGGDAATITGLANDSTSDVLVTLTYAGRVDGSICIDAPAVGGRYACTWNTTTLPNGTYTVTATMRDAAGNLGYATLSVAVYNAPPATPPVAPTPEPTTRRPRDVEAPTVQRFTVPKVTFGAYAVVRWDVTDNADGDLTYRVEQRTTTPRGAWSTWRQAGSGPSPRVIRLPKRGASTCFRVVATDAAGNKVTGPTTCTTLPLDDRELARSSGWSKRSSKFALNRTLSTTRKDGAWLRARIGANHGVSIIASTGPRAGKVRVYLGDKQLRTLSLRTKKAKYRTVIRIPGAIKPGVLRIVVVGRTGAVQVDGLAVTR